MIYARPLYLPAGDQALVVELGDEISPEINRRVHSLTGAIEQEGVSGIVDIIPTYRSLLVQYDAMGTTLADLQDRLSDIESSMDEGTFQRGRTIGIPTLYQGQYAPDLAFVAQNAGLTVDEVIGLHSGTDYLVHMMGFTPGFPYLGGLSEKLVTPRLDTPRVEIPAGSVGIADSQTGVYPVASPGGWRLIGKTPLKLFDADRDPPSLISAGDYIRFVPLANEEQYHELRSLIESGEYEPTIEVRQ